MGRDRAVADPRRRGLARRLQGLRHQADALSLLVERLVKNVLADRPLARVNAFVDLYNAVSLAHVLPLGADDLDRVTAAARLPLRARGRQLRRHGRGGRASGSAEARRGRLRDAAQVLCRRWNWRQDARTLIHAGDPARRRHRAVERRRRHRGGSRRSHATHW
jgi:hypothetical protein